MKPVISIVVPVYNSEDCLSALNEEIERAFRDFVPYELVLVNDRSPDKSWERIKEICSRNPSAVGISLRKNAGQDNAIMAGLRLAKGDYVVIMDDDLQHSPADIRLLYTKCSEGYDACFADFNEKQQSAWKNLGSWLNGKLSEKLLGKPREVYLSPFKIIRKEVVEEMIRFSGPFPYIDATLLSVTSSFTQVPVQHHRRFKGRSNYNLFRSVAVFLRHATSYSVYPLRLATYTGFCASLLSFGLAFYFIIDYFYRRIYIEGWISLMIMLIFFGGLILMSLGLIGEYVGRIYLSINSKPQYTIEKVISSSKESKVLQ